MELIKNTSQILNEFKSDKSTAAESIRQTIDIIIYNIVAIAAIIFMHNWTEKQVDFIALLAHIYKIPIIFCGLGASLLSLVDFASNFIEIISGIVKFNKSEYLKLFTLIFVELVLLITGIIVLTSAVFSIKYFW